MRFACFVLLLFGLACQAPAPKPFVALDPEQTGVDFSNTLTDGPEFNILNYPYFYNGGGVAIGDVNNDGWPDLYFTANQGPNRLYLNRGDFRFEDVTEAAGVAGSGDWATGVSMADINGDGWLDLYVSYVSGLLGQQGHNELFLNQRDGTFREAAAAHGLDLRGYGTQGAFFDFDQDGDLDLYQLNHSIKPAANIGPVSQREVRDSLAGDRLLRNDDGYFVDISAEAGISGSRLGYGLSVLTGDINADGWPDIYVCNDFHEDDYLYLNQQDGSFREALREQFGHTSRFSMGSDLGDINNDGRTDLLTLDMKPEREDILKTSEPPESFDLFQFKLSFGYFYQYPHNALHLNRGDGRFSEISQLSGIDATDWSWSALFADLDQDGWQDLFVTNGIYRRPNDMDFLKYLSSDLVRERLNQAPSAADLDLLAQMPSVPLANYAYHNQGDLRFENRAADWGLDRVGFSNGAAYGDLDRDGDLDLVVSNLDGPASVYRNELAQGHSLSVGLVGKGKNTHALGARAEAWVNGRPRLRELLPVRGFLSSVEPRLHWGLGTAVQADSLRIHWPDGSLEAWYDLPADSLLTLEQGRGQGREPAGLTPAPLWQDVTPHTGLEAARHRENDFDDFNREALMPHQLSTLGPALAVGDVNGDGREDFFLGGATAQAGSLWLQQAGGRFKQAEVPAFRADAGHEDVDALFFDADGDGDLDLYVVSGGNQVPEGVDLLRDRLYLQQDDRWVRDEAALPDLALNGSCVAVADLEGDGDLDLFVGSRAVPGKYGFTPRSQLLRNAGDGTFEAEAAMVAPGLAEAGMVSAAAWGDVDGDGDADLLLAGEWMPLQLWENANGQLQRREAGLHGSDGWWNALHLADLDGDGDLDFLAGNLGLNSDLKATAAEPCLLYVADFDENGATEPVICYTQDGQHYPWASRDELLKQIRPLSKRFVQYRDYAETPIEEIFSPDQLAGAVQKQLRETRSVWGENDGTGNFQLHPLPVEAQFAPVFAFATRGEDILLGGNFFGVGPKRGRYDALPGLWLRREKGNFQPILPAVSGLHWPGELRALHWITVDNEPLLLVARNNAGLMVWRQQP